MTKEFEGNMITVAEAAEILGIKTRGVIAAIERDRIKAKKFGKKNWALSLESVLAYKESRQHSGPKSMDSG